ncbi:MAG: hypothetical protein K2F87_04995 [Muribaculaceae bacterium]|nr:hypothetical protein [Muribaculaceae bacterium]
MKSILVCVLFGVVSTTAGAATSTRDEIERRLVIADSLHSVGRTDSAVLVGEETLRLADRENEPLLKVAANSAQGVYLRSLGRTEEALEKYNHGLEIVTSEAFRENPDQDAIEEIATLYINLAVLNLDMQNKEEAGRNAVFSCDWVAKSKDSSLKGMIYGVAGSVLTGTGKYEEALAYQSKAYENAQTSGNTEAAFRAAAYTLLLSDRLGKPVQTSEWRKKCEELLPEIQSALAVLVYYQAECSIALRGGNPGEALKWFGKILELDGIDNMPFVKYDCYNNMHLAYAEVGDYEKAYNTLIEANALRDSIWQQQKEESLRDLTVKYETKETELALARSEAHRARTLMWLFIALTLLASGVVTFLIYASRQRKRRTEEYLQGLENERIRMGRELHDGVCNDLLAVQMSLAQGADVAGAEKDIARCREAVRRVSHELMPPEFSYANLAEAAEYYVSRQREAQRGKIDIDYDASTADASNWNEIPEHTALEVYRILQEGVGNAVKHSGADRIVISLLLEGAELLLSVSDNGTFIDGGGKGVGLESIRKRAASIAGDVDLIQLPEGGTMLKLEVKIH